MGVPYSIAFLVTNLGRAGAETQLVRLAVQLAQRGVDVTGVMVMCPPYELAEPLEAAGIRVERLRMRRGRVDLRAFVSAYLLLRQWKPDLLVNFLYHANVMGRLAGHWARVPAIVSSVRTMTLGTNRERILRITDRLGDVTTTNSRLVAEGLAARGVVPPQRLRVIPNGLPVERYHPDPHLRAHYRSLFDIAEHEFVWLAVGRLEEAKDYPLLFHALATLRALSKLPFRLLIAGTGILGEALQQLACELGLQDVVHFLGLRRDVPELLNAADGLALSSRCEGLPNVVMEALAMSVPVVATQVGGLPELVDDGVSGFLVPPQDSRRLAEGLHRLMSLSTAERRQMGIRGRTHIQEHFALPHVVDQWEALFAQLLGERANRQEVAVP